MRRNNRNLLILAFAIAIYPEFAVSQECAEGCNTQGGGTFGWGRSSGMAAGGDAGYYSGGGVHGEMFPYDQQDPWLHGHIQRPPSYGGYNAFRPYNYRHVSKQQQITAGWGATRGMNYSHQFWNKYRPEYLNDRLHSTGQSMQMHSTLPGFGQLPAQQMTPQNPPTMMAEPVAPQPLLANPAQPIFPMNSIAPTHSQPMLQTPTNVALGNQTAAQRPIHIFPQPRTPE